MEQQTTAPEVQSEQPKEVVSENTESVLTTETPSPSAEPQTETKFLDLIPEEYREEKSLANFSNMDDFVKSYLSAQKLVGANKIAVPNKMSTDEDWMEVFSKLGRPAKPEDYEYKLDAEIDEAQLKSFNEEAHRIGLLPKQAERLIKFYNQMSQDQQAIDTKTFEEKQVQAQQELKKEFGAEYSKKLDQAKRLAVEAFGKDLLNKTILQDGSRLGDSIPVIKAFSMLAEKLSEDEIIKGDTSYQTAGELEKEISELTEEGSPYWNKHHPNHRKAVDQVLALREKLNG